MGVLLHLLSHIAFVVIYYLPGAVVAGAISSVIAIAVSGPLDWLLGAKSLLHDLMVEHRMNGPETFAAMGLICAFLWWWAVVFLVWTLLQRRAKRA
jgi:hypothetical protein